MTHLHWDKLMGEETFPVVWVCTNGVILLRSGDRRAVEASSLRGLIGDRTRLLRVVETAWIAFITVSGWRIYKTLRCIHR